MRAVCHTWRRTVSSASVTSLTTWNGSKQITAPARVAHGLGEAGPMSIETASMDRPAVGQLIEERVQGGGVLAGVAPDDLAVSWSETRVRYRWCFRQQISSTPMSTSPHSRSGSSPSPTTRSQIAPDRAPGDPGEAG